MFLSLIMIYQMGKCINLFKFTLILIQVFLFVFGITTEQFIITVITGVSTLISTVLFYLEWIYSSRKDLDSALIQKLLHLKAASPGIINDFSLSIGCYAYYLKVVAQQMTMNEINTLINLNQFKNEEVNILEVLIPAYGNPAHKTHT